MEEKKKLTEDLRSVCADRIIDIASKTFENLTEDDKEFISGLSDFWVKYPKSANILLGNSKTPEKINKIKARFDCAVLFMIKTKSDPQKQAAIIMSIANKDYRDTSRTETNLITLLLDESFSYFAKIFSHKETREKTSNILARLSNFEQQSKQQIYSEKHRAQTSNAAKEGKYTRSERIFKQEVSRHMNQISPLKIMHSELFLKEEAIKSYAASLFVLIYNEIKRGNAIDYERIFDEIRVHKFMSYNSASSSDLIYASLDKFFLLLTLNPAKNLDQTKMFEILEKIISENLQHLKINEKVPKSVQEVMVELLKRDVQTGTPSLYKYKSFVAFFTKDIEIPKDVEVLSNIMLCIVPFVQMEGREYQEKVLPCIFSFLAVMYERPNLSSKEKEVIKGSIDDIINCFTVNANKEKANIENEDKEKADFLLIVLSYDNIDLEMVQYFDASINKSMLTDQDKDFLQSRLYRYQQCKENLNAEENEKKLKDPIEDDKEFIDVLKNFHLEFPKSANILLSGNKQIFEKIEENKNQAEKEQKKRIPKVVSFMLSSSVEFKAESKKIDDKIKALEGKQKASAKVNDGVDPKEQTSTVSSTTIKPGKQEEKSK